jgi:Erv1 / Alr family
MDTRFWGPSGWKLLHLITFAYKPQRDKTHVCQFFNTVAFILPCKFCRASFSENILSDPIEGVCDSALGLQKWLWRMHNQVNAKLRAQGLKKEADPSFEEIAAFYKEKLSEGCSRTYFDGWDFLFSVADNHPLSRESRASTPIQNAPPLSDLHTPLLRNRWNLMEPEERMEYYKKFWEQLPHVLPFHEWRTVWLQDTNDSWSTRADALRTLWKHRKNLEAEMDLLGKTTYASLCTTLKSYRSGCAKSNRSKTCRKNRR